MNWGKCQNLTNDLTASQFNQKYQDLSVIKATKLSLEKACYH